MTAAELDGEVLSALADGTRRRVLTLLAEHEGGAATATQLAQRLPVSRVAVVKHLAVLERAGLVTSARHGREHRFTAEPRRLHETARHLQALAGEWDARLSRLKRLAEG